MAAIPKPYTIFLTTVDPLIAIWGVYLDLFSPGTVLSSLYPPFYPPLVLLQPSASVANQDPYPVPATFRFAFIQHAFHMLACAFLSTVLLRAYPGDLKVWKLLQAALLIADIGVVWSLWDAVVVQQGRGLGGKGGLRLEEWGFVGIMVVIVLFRGLFLAGVGLGGSGGSVGAKARGKKM
jgi:hypothetical protein